MKTLYEHDCDSCDYLGSYIVINKEDCLSKRGVDLYFCGYQVDKRFAWTVIARYGNSGEQYASGSAFAYGESEALTEAAQRAIKQELLTNKQYKER